MLPERSGLDPNGIAFVVDGLRPMRYTEGWEDHLDGSYHDVVRRVLHGSGEGGRL